MERQAAFFSFDGIRLYGKLDKCASAKGSVLIVHGLCEHLGRYEHVAQTLLARGFNVCRFDLRGHGRSQGEKAFLKSYTDLLQDIGTFVAECRRAWPGTKLFLVGHSMGGFAAAAYAAAFPDRVDGCILLGAATWDCMGSFAAVPADAEPAQYRENGLAERICRDPQVVQAYKADPLVAKQVSLGLYQAVCKGQRWLRENAGSFAGPVLLLHGAADQLVSEQDSRSFFGAISSADKTLHIYAGLFHELLNEPEKERIMHEMIEWMEQRI